jgi:hypothetical protein
LMVLKKEEYRKIVQDVLDRRNRERKLTLKWQIKKYMNTTAGKNNVNT